MKTLILVLILTCLQAGASLKGGSPEVFIEKGTYVPFFRDAGEPDQDVGPLYVDKFPVTNQDFLSFLKKSPQWRKSAIKSLFADATYLEHWTTDFSFPASVKNKPVVNVSWFVARRYCESQGKRLLSTAEWEYVSDAQNPENLQLILNWYSKPNSKMEVVGKAPKNSRGLVGMHGLIWEWVEDFSSAIMAGDSRSGNEASGSLFCGAGSLKAKDPTQYATFMRFGHRSSLKASSVGRSLGFRCARDAEKDEI